MFGYIYKTTCLINGKIYVGKKRPDWVVEKMRKSQQERRAREKEDKNVDVERGV